ncbi:MAG TPA: ATP-binding protein [Candidatus Saccharimonadales bacterium]|nr:ATP-binding protein [Candidatus Saccharimonadales bacterium]
MKLSLSIKISITVIGLILVGGATTSYLVSTSSTKSLKNSISTSQAQLANQSMDKLDRFLYERRVDIQELSGREQLQRFLSLPANRRVEASNTYIKQLNNYRVLGGAWENLLIADTNGTVLLNANQTGKVAPLLQDSRYKAAFAQALAGEVSYTDLLTKTSGGTPSMLFMAPVRDTSSAEQPITGVVVGELAWQSALEILRSIKNTQALLLDRQNITIGENGIKGDDPVTRNDKKYVTSTVKETGYLDYQGNGWTLILRTPTSQAFAPVVGLTRQIILTYLGILLFSVTVFLFVIRLQIKQPVSRLLAGVERLARGDFSQPVNLKNKDELGDLAHAFNDMAAKLQFAYDTLKATTQEAEDERSILQAILDNLPVGVFVAKAPNGEPVMINQVGVQLLGPGLKPGIQDAAAEVYQIVREDGSAYSDAELPMRISLKTGKPATKDDLLARRKDGGIWALRAISAPIKDSSGTVESVVGVFEDITKERVMERSKEEFFSIASHELRTPLTAVRGNTSMIKDYLWSELKNQGLKDMIDDIHDSAVRLIEIVNDFLDTSRLEQGRMKFMFVPVDMVEVAKSVIKEYQVSGSRQKILLEVQEPHSALPMVFADYNRTKQVLINLVGNALKFTDSGTITIYFMAEGTTVRTFVKDTGHGMTPEAQKRLFKKFEQSGNTVLTRDSVRGTGLGLYISKLLTENMHGHIQLESSQTGVGTTFSFMLPIESSGNHTETV